MAKLIHTMIRVTSLDASIKFYQQAFGLDETHRLDFPSFTLVYLGNAESPAEIELTLNKNQDQPYEHGTAYGHVAFSVTDLEAAHATIECLGAAPTPIKTLAQNEHEARFFFVTDPDGYKIEVLQSGGHY